jgi:hypothetical protein
MRCSKRGMVYLSLMSASVFVCRSALAVPNSVTEPLPTEDSLLRKMAETEAGKKALTFIFSLSTFQDNADPTKYYYSPAFRVSTNTVGAATVVSNDAAVGRRSEISTISQKMLSLNTEDFLTIREAYKKLTTKLGDPLLSDAERAAINAARQALKDELDALITEGNANEGELPAYVRESYLRRMGDLFGLSGIQATTGELEDVGMRTRKLGDLSASNGGFLSGNLYAGFTPEQLDLLRSYKTFRADLGLPQVRIVVLPLQSISFFSLAETYSDSHSKPAVGIPLFRGMNGSGNFQGATFNFDLTLDGAEKFSSAPPPIIVPIGVEASLTVRPPTFKASLSCDFTTGWSVEGRTDIKDGLIVYNNDITTSMVAKDISETNKPCKLSVEGGTGAEHEYAYYQALIALQKRFEDLFFERSSMAQKEKMAYWQKVQDDISANRHKGANQGWSSLFIAATRLGFVGTLLGGFANASQFYWHTNAQNIHNLSTVKFQEELVFDQNQTIKYPLATLDMCLAWNPRLKRYVACTADEERSAQTVENAYGEARQSCDQSSTTIECRDNRNTTSPVNENGNIPSQTPTPPDPVLLPDEI